MKKVTLTISVKDLKESRKQLKKIIAEKEAKIKELMNDPHSASYDVFLRGSLYDNRKWLKIINKQLKMSV